MAVCEQFDTPASLVRAFREIDHNEVSYKARASSDKTAQRLRNTYNKMAKRFPKTLDNWQELREAVYADILLLGANAWSGRQQGHTRQDDLVQIYKSHYTDDTPVFTSEEDDEEEPVAETKPDEKHPRKQIVAKRKNPKNTTLKDDKPASKKSKHGKKDD
jgi:hypothetical protein